MDGRFSKLEDDLAKIDVWMRTNMLNQEKAEKIISKSSYLLKVSDKFQVERRVAM